MRRISQGRVPERIGSTLAHPTSGSRVPLRSWHEGVGIMIVITFDIRALAEIALVDEITDVIVDGGPCVKPLADITSTDAQCVRLMTFLSIASVGRP